MAVYRTNGLPNETSPGIVAFPKSKIGASMRDPNFRSATSPRHLALGKTRFFDPQFSIFDAISKVKHVAVKKLLRARRRVLKYYIQTNITLADKMRAVLALKSARDRRGGDP